MTGMLGSEKIFDSYLSGKPGKTTFKQDIWNYVLPKSGNVVPAQDGDDVTLTIDKNIQIFVEDSLDMMVKRYKPKDIFAVVMDAKTGEILGSSQRPTFNPQTREGFGEKWANDLYQNTYEPGSTFKTFGLAAAIEENQYDPKAKYESGEREIDGITISDWNDVGWGTITMSKGFQLSSNVLMMKLQDKVGIDKMKTYYEKFGFGRSTQSLFDSEASGHISWNDELSQKVSSFGQSTTVTPAQMLQAESAIVNEGKMLKPYFVKSIKSQDNNNIYTGKKDITGQPISKSTAQKTMQQLYDVVNGKEMHAINYGLKDYKVAGKTGTAQVPDTEKGGYVQGANPYMVSFMGYAPAKDPEVIIYYGMSLAQKNDAEAYAQGVSKGYTPLMENTLKYLNVGSPDKDNAKLIFNTPDVIGKKDDKASTEIENASLKPVQIGNGRTVTNQLPAKGTKLLADDKVFILTEGAKVMPDITGWSKRDLLMFSTLTGIEIQFKGNGYAINQSIDVNNPIKQGDKLTVELDSLDPLKQSPVYNDVIKAQLQQEKEVLKEQIKDEKQKNSN